MTGGGDRTLLARKQTRRDAARACSEQVGAITRFFITHPGCGWSSRGRPPRKTSPSELTYPLGKGENSVKTFIPALSFAAFWFFCFIIQQSFPPPPVPLCQHTLYVQLLQTCSNQVCRETKKTLQGGINLVGDLLSSLLSEIVHTL